MKNTRAEELMAAYLSGNIAAAEQEELLVWVAASPEGQKFFDNAVTLWSLTEEMAYPDFSAQKANAWEKVEARLTDATVAPTKGSARIVAFNYRRWMAAAAIALLLVAGWWWMQPSVPSAIIASTLNDEQSELTLPDGTSVWLNENTYLTYEEVNGERRVQLAGEAFFDVATDSLQPFRIYAGEAITTVLGTSFNIRAYPEDAEVEVSVKEGKVALETKTKAPETENAVQKVELLPGDKGVFVKETAAISTKEEEAKNSTAWKDGKLDFENVPLAEAIKVMERYYEVDIELTTEGIGKCLFNGKYDNVTLEDLLEAVEFSMELQLEENKGVYRLAGEACE
ncbi:FecR family protein [Lewinella sp. LCG006]|uniref:FecR family protein n=1 Tax=Lewinella sp. LCG006 TaxID=3231911 RepID=UPI0034614DEA